MRDGLLGKGRSGESCGGGWWWWWKRVVKWLKECWYKMENVSRQRESLEERELVLGTCNSWQVTTSSSSSSPVPPRAALHSLSPPPFFFHRYLLPSMHPLRLTRLLYLIQLFSFFLFFFTECEFWCEHVVKKNTTMGSVSSW